MLPQAPGPASTPSLPYYQIPAQPSSVPGAPAEPQIQPYQANVYPSIMAPPQTYPPHLDSTSASMQGRYGARLEESQSPRHHASGSGTVASPIVSAIQPATPQSRNRVLPDHKSPGTSGGATSTSNAGGKGRRSPLVLMSGPAGPSGYDPTTSTSVPSASSHPKNFHAQTLILGECLRPEAIILEGPAIHIITRTIRRPVQGRRRRLQTSRVRLGSQIYPRTWMERQVPFRHHHFTIARDQRRSSKFSRQGRSIAG